MSALRPKFIVTKRFRTKLIKQVNEWRTTQNRSKKIFFFFKNVKVLYFLFFSRSFSSYILVLSSLNSSANYKVETFLFAKKTKRIE